MRHELEHVRQYEQNLYIIKSAEILNRIIELLAPELAGAHRGLYPYLPTEQDASARGTELARASFGAPPPALLAGPHASLLGTASMSGDVSTLPTRLVGMLAIFPEEAGEVVAERYPAYAVDPMAGVVEVVEGLVPGLGGELLVACMMDLEITRVRDRLTMMIIEAWAAASAGLPQSYAPVARAFDLVQRRALSLVADPKTRRQNLQRIHSVH